MTEKQAIDSAPEGDGWILACDPSLDPKVCPTAPWILATRCDGGWCDENGYGVDPKHWAPLPDPQPTPTGWRKAEGTIVLAPGKAPSMKWAGYLICVDKPDGSVDQAREWIMEDSLEGARARAALEAEKLGLPIVERLSDAAFDSLTNVVPIGTGKAPR